MQIKALALLSGGLDSTLVIGLMLQEGIAVEVINFIIPFCTDNKPDGHRSEAERITEGFGVRLKRIDIFEELMEIIKHPRYGYGKGINPCIDCHTLMLKKAKEYMPQAGASFVVTGEVLGQRPMSQHLRAMEIIEKESGLEGLVVRPLSARRLKPTIPEQNGWLNRENLLDISGRSRKPQIQLAKQLGITQYQSPAGGCLLTDRIFAKKMRDLLDSIPNPTRNDVQFLKLGRHFRLSEGLKVIVARNDEENKRLVSLIEGEDISLQVTDQKGPITVLRGKADREDLLKAASITARYSDDKGEGGIVVSSGSAEEETLFVQAMDDEEIAMLRI